MEGFIIPRPGDRVATIVILNPERHAELVSASLQGKLIF
jgi:hypothetical protein